MPGEHSDHPSGDSHSNYSSPLPFGYLTHAVFTAGAWALADCSDQLVSTKVEKEFHVLTDEVAHFLLNAHNGHHNSTPCAPEKYSIF